jgi:uncharacterized protein (TIGR00730 family)
MSDETKPEFPPVPFLNLEFLKSPPARVLRILSEYLEPAERLRRARVRDTIVFFGSARSPSPEQAAQQLELVREQIGKAGAEPSAELTESLSHAEALVRLARYYQSAVELAQRLTEWSKALTGNRDFIICSGGSGGMMEAANRGASLAGGKTMGFNIHLPAEQAVNPFVSQDLVFNFHYFFMRKFWFVYLAKALVIFPGGYGTMDEFFEVLTLIQTQKPRKKMPVVLFGSEYWDEVIDFEAFVRWGTVTRAELDCFYKTDSVDDAYAYITTKLEALYTTPEGLNQVKLT